MRPRGIVTLIERFFPHRCESLDLCRKDFPIRYRIVYSLIVERDVAATWGLPVKRYTAFYMTVLLAAFGLGFSTAKGFELVSDLPSGQSVGTLITWNITGGAGMSVGYRLIIKPPAEPARVVYDFSARNSFEWAPIEDGDYLVRAVVRDLDSGMVTFLSPTLFQITPIANVVPIVSSVSHPLVALYSAPSCPVGNKMRVQFRASDQAAGSVTSAKPCRFGHSMNFYVGGMRPNVQYVLRHQILDAADREVERGPLRIFFTGTPPPPFDTVAGTVEQLPGADSSLDEPVVLHSGTGPGGFPFATDLRGRLIWYFDDGLLGRTVLNRPLPGGTFLVRAPDDTGRAGQRLWEIDLVGHIVRETTAARVAKQLAAVGQDPISEFHHASRQLPDGSIAVLGYTERIVSDIQGPGDVDVIGDTIVVLDENWQVNWVWNSFEKLDLSRLAVLGEVCTLDRPGCPTLVLAEQANDWLHSNAIDYSATDGNLILSVRHQDWVLKLDYRDGLGSGDVIWRLGVDGDFS